ncbi:MAG TPA: hypothetical protein VE988_19080 [Gemmataceae bacterium]|nr:hypothetical protein [Gemmataceae bacterium]
MLDWQLLLVALIITAAATYVVRAGWRVLRGGKGGCATGSCGCAGKSASSGQRPIPLQQLTLRRREPGDV